MANQIAASVIECKQNSCMLTRVTGFMGEGGGGKARERVPPLERPFTQVRCLLNG